MENTKYGRRREGGWTPTRAKAQAIRANPNSWETHLVRKRWDIGLLRALSLRIMMMMMISIGPTLLGCEKTHPRACFKENSSLHISSAEAGVYPTGCLWAK